MKPGFAVVPIRVFSDASDFRVRYGSACDILIRRIEMSGILSPLLTIKKSPEHYEIVSGFRRFAAAKALGVNEVPVCFFAQEAADRKTIFKIALLLNEAAELTDLDKAVSVRKARDVFRMDWKELGAIASLMGLPPSQKVLEEYAEIGGMPDWILERMEAGDLPLKAARALLGMTTAEQECFIREILTKCDWSASEAVTAVEWMEDVGKRENCTVKEILTRKEFALVLDEENISRKEKGRKILGILRKNRYPVSGEVHEKIRVLTASVRESEGLEIGTERFFEEELLEVRMQLRSFAELRKKLDCILGKEKHFKALFDLVQ